MNSEPQPSHRSVWFAWLLLLIAAILFRLHELSDVSAWYDEAASWKTISLSWPGMWESLRRNVHPPVYYVAVRSWAAVLGDSIVSLRLFSVLCGILTLPVIEMLAREVSIGSSHSERSRLPHLATWAYALSPIAIEQSQQTRMYALAILFAAGLSWGLVRVLREPACWSGWLGLSLCGNLLPLTHYYGLWNSAMAALVLVTVSVFQIRQRLINCRWQWAAALGISLAAWAGWLPEFLDQHSRVHDSYWIPEFTISELTIFIAEWSSSPHVRELGLGVIWLTCGLTLVAAAALLLTRSPGRLALAALAIGPPVLSTLYSLWTRNLLQGRYWCFAHLNYLVAVALLITALRVQTVRRVGAAVLLLGLLGWSVQGLRNRAALAQNAGLRECGTALLQRRLPHEPVFVASPYYGPSIQRYLPQASGVYILKPYQPLNHFQGQAIIRPDELRTINNDSLGDTDRFWIVADELLSLTIQNPQFVAIPPGWKRVTTTAYQEANRLPTRLELWEYVRVK